MTKEFTDEESLEMAQLGIICETTNYFLVGKYRYTNLKDACAAARRLANEDGKLHRGTSGHDGR